MMTGLGLFIGGQWSPGNGEVFSRNDPTTGGVVWQQHTASVKDVDRAIEDAEGCAPKWAAMGVEKRATYLDAFAEAVKAHGKDLLDTICRETGKPRWETQTEVDALHKKVALTKRALAERRSDALVSKQGLTTAARYKPLGVVAVIGPFNLPAHLPNGQIVPALLAGNTVVFKPSELTPGVGEVYAACWEAAGIPPGVFNLIQGGREQGAALAAHRDIGGVFFTGSHAGGIALSKAVADHPEKLLALEMGGNNPLAVANASNLDAAVYTIVQSAFITSGQRCTCARRLILLQDPQSDRLLERLVQVAQSLLVGPYTMTPEPFMGPVISEAAAARLLEAQDDLLARGAAPLLRMRPVDTRVNMLSPGILDVTAVGQRRDEELFGPLLQVIRVADFGAALAEANRTRFGLAAALLSDDAALYERFFDQVRAGIVNWNRPTTGAAGDLPFGGIGASGNHRPAGFSAIDFCSDPVASLESQSLALPAALSPGITL